MKTLHTAYRVTDLAASLAFYTALGYVEIGRVDIGGGAILTMPKFPQERVCTLEHRSGSGWRSGWDVKQSSSERPQL